MLSCNETMSECTESESSEQFFECNENPSLDRLEPITSVDNFQESTKNGLPLDLSRGNSTDRNPNVKIDNDLTRVAFKRSSSVPKAEDRVPQPIRRISLEHKIDIGDDIEPPLIIDSTSPNASMNTIAEVIPVALQPRIDLQATSVPESQENSPNDPPTEIYLPKSELTAEVKASPSEISPPLADPPQESESQKQSPGTPKDAIKKSQNLSTDFDLSEQLQKILGISSEKTRGDSSAERKGEAARGVKICDDSVMKVPSVKIDSPESQKTR